MKINLKQTVQIQNSPSTSVVLLRLNLAKADFKDAPTVIGSLVNGSSPLQKKSKQITHHSLDLCMQKVKHE